MSKERISSFESENPLEGNEWVFESDPKMSDQVAQEVEKRLKDLGWNDDQIDSFDLAVSEAVANAIVHGNRGDINKKIRVISNLTEEEAEVTVCDEGKGFDLKRLPDPMSEEQLLKSSGRGVMLMIEKTENPVFFPNEGKVILRKHRQK